MCEIDSVEFPNGYIMKGGNVGPITLTINQFISKIKTDYSLTINHIKSREKPIVFGSATPPYYAIGGNLYFPNLEGAIYNF